jgi:replicative DNA helicase
MEQNVFSIPLIVETMKDEGEDEEIISNIELLNKQPTVTTLAEVQKLCIVLADYIKYAKILKVKDSFLSTLDMIDDDDANIKTTVDTLYKISNEIVNAYNSASFQQVSHSFDTDNKDQMRNVLAVAKDARSSDKTIITGIRGLNNLLSPGYLSGCLYIYAALPGCYKSGILLQSHIDTCKYNEHIKHTTNGKTPISMYISMENTMSQTIRRLWSLLFPSADLSMYSVEEAMEMIDNALTAKGFRSVILYYGYREKSTADLYEIIRGFNTDDSVVVALYLDYIKRIRPARTEASVTSSEKSELHAIMNELKTIASQFDIPIVSGHQLNRMAAQAVDQVVSSGGYGKTSEVLGRSQISVAWEIMEVADWLAVMNIENDGENKMLMIKAVKQRDLDNSVDVTITAIRHPFLSPESFALRQDIMENCSISIPIYTGKHQLNYMANI